MLPCNKLVCKNPLLQPIQLVDFFELHNAVSFCCAFVIVLHSTDGPDLLAASKSTQTSLRPCTLPLRPYIILPLCETC